MGNEGHCEWGNDMEWGTIRMGAMRNEGHCEWGIMENGGTTWSGGP